MIWFKNKGYKFFIASGMLGFDGNGPTTFHRMIYDVLGFLNLYEQCLFARVLKTFTFRKTTGKKTIVPKRNGWYNNFGLDNPGRIEFFRNFAPRIKEEENVIFSIAGENKLELKALISRSLECFPKLLAIEYNVSCPNLEYHKLPGIKEISKNCEMIVNAFDIPLLLKIGYINEQYEEIAKSVEGVVAAIDINSIPCPTGGALSGKISQEINWLILKNLVKITKVPIVAPSIWHYKDIDHVLNLGASAVSFGSVSLPHPMRPWAPALPTLWARRWKKEEKKKDHYLSRSAAVKSGRK